MRDFLITLLLCSVTMSVLALFYMALTPCLAKRHSVTGRYYAWLVLIIGFIIPFRPHFGNAMIQVDVQGGMVEPTLQAGNGIPVAAIENALPFASTSDSWWQAAVVIWLVGMAVSLFYHGFKHYRFLKLAARWSETVTDEQTLALFQAMKTQVGISSRMALQVCDSIGSPMLIGFVNPRVLLPKVNFAKEELCFILKHELVHYRRKDLWYKCLVLLATTVHWFNPVVYLAAKAIDLQCELSCDEEVVRGAGADTRQCYSETIIGVIRYQSELKTALSTHFYGGKKGMKERICFIMDARKKKAGLAILFGALVLTLGTGLAFAVNAEVQNPSESIKEDIMVSAVFLPDPTIYEKYSSYGITISEDGKMLRYNGQRVRLFVDESVAEAFFLDEAGALDLTVARNAAGAITGIESISASKARDYRTAFLAEGRNTGNAPEDEVQDIAKDIARETEGQNKYAQYAAYGITLSADGEALQYNGQRVKLFVDQLSDGSFESYWFDEAGTAKLTVVRNSVGQITTIQSISEEQAQKYYSN